MVVKITRHGQEQEVEQRLRPTLPVSDGGCDGGVLIDGGLAKCHWLLIHIWRLEKSVY